MPALTALIPASVGQIASFITGGALGVWLGHVSHLRRPMPELVLPSNGGSVSTPGERWWTFRTIWHRSHVPNGSPVARRARTGRLPLPQRVADLTPGDVPALGAVNEFVDRLAELPVGDWLEVGRSVISDGSTTNTRPAAVAILQATIGARRLSIAAWYVRDAVETSAFFASHSVPKWTPSERRVFAAAHAAAEDAALALLVRGELESQDFALLVEPFTRLAPATC